MHRAPTSADRPPHLTQSSTAQRPDALRWQWAPFAGLDLARFHAIAQLRQRVFVVEQGCAYLDLDGRDALAWHLCGWIGDPGATSPTLAAYLRVFPAGCAAASPEAAVIGRVIVAPEWRGRGLSRALMAEALRRYFADCGGPQATTLSAQAHLEALYASLGYHRQGPNYLEDGIPHLPMARPAQPAPIWSAGQGCELKPSGG